VRFAVLSPNFVAICEDFLAAKERKEHKKGISSLRSLCSFAAYGFGCGLAALSLRVKILAFLAFFFAANHHHNISGWQAKSAQVMVFFGQNFCNLALCKNGIFHTIFALEF
jgi:hypothetical protein